MGDTFTLEEQEGTEGGDGKKEFPLIPDGTIVNAEVLSITKKPMPYKDEKTGEFVVRVEWEFKIVDDPEYSGRLWGNTSTKFTTHPDCRMRAWVSEILGADVLPKDFRFNTDTLVGQKCRVVVEVYEFFDKKKNAQQFRNRVQDVIRKQNAYAGAPVGGSMLPVDDEEPF